MEINQVQVHKKLQWKFSTDRPSNRPSDRPSDRPANRPSDKSNLQKLLAGAIKKTLFIIAFFQIPIYKIINSIKITLISLLSKLQFYWDSISQIMPFNNPNKMPCSPCLHANPVTCFALDISRKFPCIRLLLTNKTFTLGNPNFLHMPCIWYLISKERVSKLAMSCYYISV